jgi:hypothetical protein
VFCGSVMRLLMVAIGEDERCYETRLENEAAWSLSVRRKSRRRAVLLGDAKCGQERSGPNAGEFAVRVTGSV